MTPFGELNQNFTWGAASTSVRVAPRSKKSFRVKPNMPANNAAGICWMPVLYSWTALFAGMLGFTRKDFFDLGTSRTEVEAAPQVKF